MEPHSFKGFLSRKVCVSLHRKGMKPFCILTKKKLFVWQWHKLMPLPHTSFAPHSTQHLIVLTFTGQMLFLKPSQQNQSNRLPSWTTAGPFLLTYLVFVFSFSLFFRFCALC